MRAGASGGGIARSHLRRLVACKKAIRADLVRIRAAARKTGWNRAGRRARYRRLQTVLGR